MPDCLQKAIQHMSSTSKKPPPTNVPLGMISPTTISAPAAVHMLNATAGAGYIFPFPPANFGGSLGASADGPADGPRSMTIYTPNGIWGPTLSKDGGPISHAAQAPSLPPNGASSSDPSHDLVSAFGLDAIGLMTSSYVASSAFSATYDFPSTIPDDMMLTARQMGPYGLSQPHPRHIKASIATFVEWSAAPINTERSQRCVMWRQMTS